MLNRKVSIAAGLLALGSVFAGTAHAADVHWSIGINLPVVGTVVSNAPVYHGQRPVYMPAPAPVVVYQPAPRVVYRPVPVYAPKPVRGGWGRDHGRHDRYDRDDRRGDRGDRDDRGDWRDGRRGDHGHGHP
jgi:hypothetical protein